jgi:hypothetical protein
MSIVVESIPSRWPEKGIVCQGLDVIVRNPPVGPIRVAHQEEGIKTRPVGPVAVDKNRECLQEMCAKILDSIRCREMDSLVKHKLLEYIYAPDPEETVAWCESPCAFANSTQELLGE